MEQQGEIVLYQPETTFKLEVRLENETVWLTQAQIAELFGTGRQAITKHLKNIFNSNELEENSVCSILELTAADGKTYNTNHYNLSTIIAVPTAAKSTWGWPLGRMLPTADDIQDGYEEDELIDDYDLPAHWLMMQMNNFCVGANYVFFNGKHYYTVHHS